MISLISRGAAGRLGVFLMISLSTAFAAVGAPDEPAAQQPAAEEAAAPPEDAGTARQPEAMVATGRYTKQGLVVDFSAKSLDSDKLMEGLMADVRFRISEEATGEPVKGLAPGAWMDIGGAMPDRPGAEQKECKDKIALYLRGAVGIRPMIDLNSYYVLVLNKDPSITVVDPLISLAGRTSTLSVIVLEGPPMDWAKSADGRWLFVTMPTEDQVAVVDTLRFLVQYNVEAGDAPTRVAVQPDGKFVWVGNDSRIGEKSGITVLDTGNLALKAQFATGRGHHEFAFSADSRYALVTNRDAGTVTVVDVEKLEKLKDIEIGGKVLSVVYSPLANAFYVTDGDGGVIHVIDAATLEVVKRIQAKRGLGPMKASQDGRWVMAVNSVESVVNVVDTSSNTLIHTLDVGKVPFQVSFTRAFAYVRSLDTERVNMINLASLGEGSKPIVQSFAAGSLPPKAGGDLVIADSIAAAEDEAAVFVVNPADNTTYFYMEGMNAPMGNYRTYGHQARAVTVVDRSLKEVEPGVYAGKVRIPAAGRYDVAFLLDTPELLHCFSMDADKNPMLRVAPEQAYDVEFPLDNRVVDSGEAYTLRFKLIDNAARAPKEGVKDVRLRYFRAPATSGRVEIPARDVGDGVYEAELRLSVAGVYYLYVSAPSLEVEYGDLAYATLRVREPAKAKAPKAGGEG